MRRKPKEFDPPDELPFVYPSVESEEEKVWLKSRVPREVVLAHEGLTIFSLLVWKGNRWE